MAKSVFDMRREEDPQGVIDGLVKQTSSQGAEIYKLNQRIIALQDEIAVLKGEKPEKPAKPEKK